MFHSVLYVAGDLEQMTRLVVVHLDENGVMIPGKASIRNSIDIVRHIESDQWKVNAGIFRILLRTQYLSIVLTLMRKVG